MHAAPIIVNKAVEAGRYYASEAMRNPKLQKKATDYGMKKLDPFIHNVGSQAINQLSTKAIPNKRYKTDRKDLDGGGIIDSLLPSGVNGSPWQVDKKRELNC